MQRTTKEEFFFHCQDRLVTCSCCLYPSETEEASSTGKTSCTS